jgi:hypothetical protein
MRSALRRAESDSPLHEVSRPPLTFLAARSLGVLLLLGLWACGAGSVSTRSLSSPDVTDGTPPPTSSAGASSPPAPSEWRSTSFSAGEVRWDLSFPRDWKFDVPGKVPMLRNPSYIAHEGQASGRMTEGAVKIDFTWDTSDLNNTDEVYRHECGSGTEEDAHSTRLECKVVTINGRAWVLSHSRSTDNAGDSTSGTESFELSTLAGGSLYRAGAIAGGPDVGDNPILIQQIFDTFVLHE